MHAKRTDDEIVKYMIDMMRDRGRTSQGNCIKLDLSNNLNPAERNAISDREVNKKNYEGSVNNAALDTALVMITH